MGLIHHSAATLRFFGDDLVPEQITELLGAMPTVAVSKGQEILGKASGVVRIAKIGSWRLDATSREPEGLEAQIFELLDQLTADLGVWAMLSRYEPDLFCGIFLGSRNDSLPLSPKALIALGQRGIALELDIYDATSCDACEN